MFHLRTIDARQRIAPSEIYLLFLLVEKDGAVFAEARVSPRELSAIKMDSAFQVSAGDSALRVQFYAGTFRLMTVHFLRVRAHDTFNAAPSRVPLTRFFSRRFPPLFSTNCIAPFLLSFSSHSPRHLSKCAIRTTRQIRFCSARKCLGKK